MDHDEIAADAAGACFCVRRNIFQATTAAIASMSNHAQEDRRLLRLIQASFARHGIDGAPRVLLDLREAGETRQMPEARKVSRAGRAFDPGCEG